ncbi:MAG: alpha/beta fold hydrolase [Dichotomicrobium sp.]
MIHDLRRVLGTAIARDDPQPASSRLASGSVTVADALEDRDRRREVTTRPAAEVKMNMQPTWRGRAAIKPLAGALAAFLGAGAVSAEDLPYTRHSVEAPDGVTLAVQEWGDPDGPAILFVHGFAASHLVWRKQVIDPELAEDFRMITFDTRGSGMSEKPTDPEFYHDGERHANDIAAIIDELELDRPVLVAWSSGGLVVGDYISQHGDGAIGGLVFAGGIFVRDPDLYGPATAELPSMASPDLATNVAATMRFVAAQFERDPGGAAEHELLATMMMTPPDVRGALLERPAISADAWVDVNVPVRIIHGEEDRVIRPAMAEEGRRLIPQARLTLREGIGHAPFLEDSETFNRDLADFIHGVNG